jgi:nitrate reductase molybdenum cofactor assembly chaperone NarJ/NarW
MPDHRKIVSVLLQYPADDALDARDEILAAIAELPDGPQRRALQRFSEFWANASRRELAETYVATFDLRKRASLYLTFYAHGDTRKRGMALLRLKKLYRAAGFPWDSSELPDFLPAMLEFAAIAPAGYGECVLGEHRAELEALRLALNDLGSPYALLLDVVAADLGEVDDPQRARLLDLIRDGPPHEEVGLAPFAPPEVMPTGAHS